MSTTDDQPPSDEDPPTVNIPRNLTRVIRKLSNAYELHDYVKHLAFYNAHNFEDEAAELKHRLLLQGLDDNDMYTIHDYLKVDFDGELMKIADQKKTEKRANILHFI